MYFEKIKIYLKLLVVGSCLLGATGVFSEPPVPLTRIPSSVAVEFKTLALSVDFENTAHCPVWPTSTKNF